MIKQIRKVGVKLGTDWFEPAVIALCLFFGALAGVLSMLTASHYIAGGFYNTIAQILPVFLVALAVEQRLVDRLGISEDEYAKRAKRSADLAVKAEIAYEDEEGDEGKRIELLLDGEQEFQWVRRHSHDLLYAHGPDDAPDIETIARTRYRHRRRNEAVFVVSTALLLIVGEGAALGGMLQAGTSRCAPYLGLSVGSTVAVVFALTLSGGREMVNMLRR